MTHEHPDDLLDAYAFGDCPEPWAQIVTAHIAQCVRCAALVQQAKRAAEWFSVSHAAAPPAGLRDRVLTAARAVRPPLPAAPAEAAEPYLWQVVEFGALLGGLSAAHWRAPTPSGRTVQDLVLHLAGNDHNVSADLGDRAGPRPGDAIHVWREQTDRLLQTIGRADDALLAQPVRLAGKAPLQRPLREALVQRAFETWTHGDDIRTAINLPTMAPAPEHLARIVGFGLQLLPAAMDAAGRGHPGAAVRLELTGPGGADHLVPLSVRGTDPPRVVGAVRMPADRFGRLMAGRVTVTEAAAVRTGDRAAGLDLLTVAATLGCE